MSSIECDPLQTVVVLLTFFLLYHITHVTCFEIIFEIVVSIDLIPSISRFVLSAWHCRHCVQEILKQLGHSIVDDNFPFVKDGLMWLWEHRISCSYSLNHIIYESWSSQKKNVHKFVWNIFIIPIHDLVYFQQNTKQFL